FEVLLNATSMFNHSNVRMPAWLDRVLRLVVVTPDMHRVHHSVIRREANSNYGFNLPWWDFLLGTYRDHPREGHQRMTIGITHLRDEKQNERLPGILSMPFWSRPGSYPITSKEDEHDEERDHADSIRPRAPDQTRGEPHERDPE
ncbi:MAG: sterol desaturase family protein, partial [Novipirellula sp. JB048]